MGDHFSADWTQTSVSRARFSLGPKGLRTYITEQLCLTRMIFAGMKNEKNSNKSSEEL